MIYTHIYVLIAVAVLISFLLQGFVQAIKSVFGKRLDIIGKLSHSILLTSVFLIVFSFELNYIKIQVPNWYSGDFPYNNIISIVTGIVILLLAWFSSRFVNVFSRLFAIMAVMILSSLIYPVLISSLKNLSLPFLWLMINICLHFVVFSYIALNAPGEEVGNAFELEIIPGFCEIILFYMYNLLYYVIYYNALFMDFKEKSNFFMAVIVIAPFIILPVVIWILFSLFYKLINILEIIGRLFKSLIFLPIISKVTQLKLFCLNPDCLSYSSPDRADFKDGVRYCEYCGKNVDSIGINKVVLKLDRNSDRSVLQVNGQVVTINWFAFNKGKELDFDEIEISNADDMDVEKFVMIMTNKIRRHKDYKNIPVRISEGCNLSLNKKNLLYHTFRKK